MMLQNTRWQPQASVLRFRALASLLTIDAFCIVIGFALTAWLRGMLLGGTAWLIVLAALMPIYFFTAAGLHAYSANTLQSARHTALKGAHALLVSVCAIILVAFYLRASESFSRLVILAGTGTTLAMIVMSRYIFVRNMVWLIRGNPFSVMLLHDGISPLPTGEFSVVQLIDEKLDPDSQDPMMYDYLARIIGGADRIVVACATEQRVAWANALKGANVQSEIFIPELAALNPLGVSSCNNVPTVTVAVGPLGNFDRFLKRAFDIVVAMAAIIAIGPIFIFSAIMIKLDSKGPVFFRQVRIGCNNQMFQIWKFRSMRVETTDGAGHRSASRDDNRITRIGRLLRRTSLDELPQLFNVLKGDMSIVGPRPHALGSRAADKLFWEVDERYWHRHAVKPGLTGLAQVRGYRGATVIEEDLRNRLQADLEYLENWSLWHDVKIIFMTFGVLFHRNAY
jgi:exopolysaccharide biosynthesis polyprenyl glycosylphosphotransferase